MEEADFQSPGAIVDLMSSTRHRPSLKPHLQTSCPWGQRRRSNRCGGRFVGCLFDLVFLFVVHCKLQDDKSRCLSAHHFQTGSEWPMSLDIIKHHCILGVTFQYSFIWRTHSAAQECSQWTCLASWHFPKASNDRDLCEFLGYCLAYWRTYKSKFLVDIVCRGIMEVAWFPWSRLATHHCGVTLNYPAMLTEAHSWF